MPVCEDIFIQANICSESPSIINRIKPIIFTLWAFNRTSNMAVCGGGINLSDIDKSLPLM